MGDLNLNEGQEFHAGGKRLVIRGGVPVQVLIKKGALGGDVQRLGDLKWVKGERLYITGIMCDEQPKNNNVHVAVDASNAAGFNFIECPSNLIVEINVPQPQAKGRVMTAGEAARLPDIVGKRVMVEGVVKMVEKDSFYGLPLQLSFFIGDNPYYAHESIKIEVLD